MTWISVISSSARNTGPFTIGIEEQAEDQQVKVHKFKRVEVPEQSLRIFLRQIVRHLLHEPGREQRLL